MGKIAANLTVHVYRRQYVSVLLQDRKRNSLESVEQKYNILSYRERERKGGRGEKKGRK